MIREIIHININVTDIERSIAFYRVLGFEVMHEFGTLPDAGRELRGMKTGDGEVCGAIMSLGDHPRSATKIELLQWLGEQPAEGPEPRSRRAPGVARLALRTKDLCAFCDGLRRRGVAFEQEPVEIDVVGAQRFALFRDPDGTLLELVEFFPSSSSSDSAGNGPPAG